MAAEQQLRIAVDAAGPLVARGVDAAPGALGRHPLTAGLPVGLFGASTGAAAALVVAARRPETVAVVVPRGGRADLAGAWFATRDGGAAAVDGATRAGGIP
jgi:hypothetical protein